MIYSSGILPEVLITTVSLIGVRVPETELRFIHAMFDYNANGFMAFHDMSPLELGIPVQTRIHGDPSGRSAS